MIPHPETVQTLIKAWGERAQWLLDAEEIERGAEVQACKHELESLLSSLPQREWQPISSAPKDGTWILVHGKHWKPVHVEVATWSVSCNCWQTMDDGLSGVTHWMPLPAPPVDTEPT